MSDTYYCAKTGKPFEADWSVRCECTTCMPLDAPEPPMTRCPKCGLEEHGAHICTASHPNLVHYSAPHNAPLDFEKAARDAKRKLKIPEGHWEVSTRMTDAFNAALTVQARAYADAAVKAERARIAMALIECEDIHGRGKAERGAGCDYCAGWLDAADFVTTSGEARDDHR